MEPVVKLPCNSSIRKIITSSLSSLVFLLPPRHITSHRRHTKGIVAYNMTGLALTPPFQKIWSKGMEWNDVGMAAAESQEFTMRFLRIGKLVAIIGNMLLEFE